VLRKALLRPFLRKQESIKNKDKEIDNLLEKATVSYGATILSVVNGMQKLLDK